MRHAPSRRASGMRSPAAAGVAVTLLAAVARLPTLGQQSYWLDEGYTVRLLRMSFSGMLHAIPKTESTPPLYYAVGWLWTRMFGDAEYGLRSLSALAGIATVTLAWAIARRLAGPRAAAIAGLLAAVSPLLVWFSQEARSYALATLLATASVLCVVAWMQEGGSAWLAGWALAAALGLATHYFVAFIVAPEVVLLWRERPRAGRHPAATADPRARRHLATAVGLVAIVGLALVPLALAQRGTGHADYIAQGPLGTRVLQVPKQMLLGYASPAQVFTASLAAAAVLVGAVWPLVIDAGVRARARVPLTIGVAGVVVPVTLAVVGIDFLDTRNLLPALPALYVAAGVGFAASRGWPRGGVLALVLAVISVSVVVLVDATPRFQRDDWRGAETALGVPRGPRAIVVTPASGVIPLQAYLPTVRALSGPAAVRELDVIAIPPQTTGQGMAVPPRPAAPLPVPAGFRLARAVYTRTYSALRYVAPRPVAVTPAALAPDHLGADQGLALIQP
ncbi:MAG: glycosyltransferase family 39 protein [Solirubrobacteraceae bacterium]